MYIILIEISDSCKLKYIVEKEKKRKKNKSIITYILNR